MQQQTVFGRRGRAAPEPRFRALERIPAPVAPVEQSEAPFSRAPFATLAILTLLFAIYTLELMGDSGINPGQPGHDSLMHLGGVSRNLVIGGGQVWRLLTAPLLHASMAHIIGNGVALILIGLLLEPIVGWRWFLAIYMACGVTGSLASLGLNAGNVLSVGASGAIVGVLACALVLSFHPASYDRRKRIWIMCARVGVPALLPLAGAAGHIDYSAHAGGAFAGMTAGYLLQIVWDTRHTRPPFPTAAGLAGLVMGVASLAVLGVAAAMPTSGPAEQTRAGLIPGDRLPVSKADAARRAPELVQAYPLDPRAHAFAAERWRQSGDLPEAVAELHATLHSPLLHASEMPPDLEVEARMTVVALEAKAGDWQGARDDAAPLCAASSTLDAKFAAALKKSNLCPAVG